LQVPESKTQKRNYSNTHLELGALNLELGIVEFESLGMMYVVSINKMQCNED